MHLFSNWAFVVIICGIKLHRNKPLTEWRFNLLNWHGPHFPPFLPNGFLNYMWQHRQDLSVCFRVHLAAIISNISRIHWARSRGSHAYCNHDAASQMLHRWRDVLCCFLSSFMFGSTPGTDESLASCGVSLYYQWWIMTGSPMESGDWLPFLWLILYYIYSYNMVFFNQLLLSLLDSWMFLIVPPAVLSFPWHSVWLIFFPTALLKL